MSESQVQRWCCLLELGELGMRFSLISSPALLKDFWSLAHQELESREALIIFFVRSSNSTRRRTSHSLPLFLNIEKIVLCGFSNPTNHRTTHLHTRHLLSS